MKFVQSLAIFKLCKMLCSLLWMFVWHRFNRLHLPSTIAKWQCFCARVWACNVFASLQVRLYGWVVFLQFFTCNDLWLKHKHAAMLFTRCSCDVVFFSYWNVSMLKTVWRIQFALKLWKGQGCCKKISDPALAYRLLLQFQISNRTHKIRIRCLMNAA